MNQVNKIVSLCKAGNNGIFFGAGMSFNSGIPTVSTIIWNILASLKQDKYFSEIIKLDYPFESFMEDVAEYIEISPLLNLFKEGNPNHFHAIVKELFEKKYVSSIMTTNFDLLIEKSCISEISNVYKNENDFKRISKSQKNYIKIHGCVSIKKTIRTTMSKIFKNELQVGRKKAINYFFKESNLNNIVVLGYSCSDVIDINPTISEIKDSKTKIIFVEHDSSSSAQIKSLKKHKTFSQFEGFWIKMNTDLFLEELYKSLFLKNITLIKESVSIDKYFRFPAIKDGISELIVGNIFFRNCEYEKAKDIFEEILTHKLEDTIRAEINTQILEVYYNLFIVKKLKIDLYKLAFPLFMEANLIYMSMSKIDNNDVGQLYNHWGHILGALKKYDDALDAYYQALRHFKNSNNHYRIAQIWNNCGHIFTEKYKTTALQSDFIEAKINFKKCINYIKRSGKIREYSIILYNLSELFFYHNSQTKTALNYVTKSKDIADKIGDKTGILFCNRLLKKIKRKSNSTKVI